MVISRILGCSFASWLLASAVSLSLVHPDSPAFGQTLPYATTVTDPDSGDKWDATLTFNTVGQQVLHDYSYVHPMPGTIRLIWDPSTGPTIDTFNFTIPAGVSLPLIPFGLTNLQRQMSSSFDQPPPWEAGQTVKWTRAHNMHVTLNIYYKAWYPIYGHPHGGMWTGTQSASYGIPQQLFEKQTFTLIGLQ
jgi:hypothetical protein